MWPWRWRWPCSPASTRARSVSFILHPLSSAPAPNDRAPSRPRPTRPDPGGCGRPRDENLAAGPLPRRAALGYDAVLVTRWGTGRGIARRRLAMAPGSGAPRAMDHGSRTTETPPGRSARRRGGGRSAGRFRPSFRTGGAPSTCPGAARRHRQRAAANARGPAPPFPPRPAIRGGSAGRRVGRRRACPRHGDHHPRGPRRSRSAARAVAGARLSAGDRPWSMRGEDHATRTTGGAV